MKWWIAAVVWMGAGAMLWAQSAAEARAPVTSLSLEQALQRASEANFDLLIGELNVANAEQQKRRSRAGLLPSLSAEVTQSRSQSYFQIDESINGRAITNRFDALLRARLSLFDLQNWADFGVADYNVTISRLELESLAQQVLEGIAQGYLTHWRNLQRLEVIEANIARDQLLLEAAQDRFDAGVATVLDVTRAEVQLAASELERSIQETAVVQSALALQEALNLPMSATLELSAPAIRARWSEADVASELARIYARRPEMIAAEQTLQRNLYARRAANWERLPSLELSGQYGMSGPTWKDDKDQTWAVQLGLSVPIFEGFQLDASAQQASIAVRQQLQVIDQLKLAIEADFRLARQDLRARQTQMRIADKQVALSRRELELASTQFEEGVADNRDLVDAQARLANALDQQVEAQYQFHLSLLALARVQGDVWSLLRE